MLMLMAMQLMMFLLLTVYIGLVPKSVPEGFWVFLMITTTYKNPVPLVPQAGTKDKPIAVPCCWELLTFVPIIRILITN